MSMTASAIQPRPHGRDEVVAAIQVAALELLADRGPREVTVRDIAAAAGVNHALVHRHFGTKDELIRTVLREESASIARAASDGGRDTAGLLALLDEHPAYWRILARTVLDSPDLLDGVDMPAADAFVHLVGGARRGASARTNAAMAGALVLGWIVFGEHLSRVVDVDVDGADLAAAVARVVSAR